MRVQLPRKCLAYVVRTVRRCGDITIDGDRGTQLDRGGGGGRGGGGSPCRVPLRSKLRQYRDVETFSFRFFFFLFLPSRLWIFSRVVYTAAVASGIDHGHQSESRAFLFWKRYPPPPTAAVPIAPRAHGLSFHLLLAVTSIHVRTQISSLITWNPEHYAG